MPRSTDDAEDSREGRVTAQAQAGIMKIDFV